MKENYKVRFADCNMSASSKREHKNQQEAAYGAAVNLYLLGESK